LQSHSFSTVLDGEEHMSDGSSVGRETAVLVGIVRTGADGALTKTVVLVGIIRTRADGALVKTVVLVGLSP
jgi:hypothetical protein